MNIWFLIKKTDDPSEEEKFQILELGSSKELLKAFMVAYAKQFCDDHDIIRVDEIKHGVIITYEWPEDDQPHKTQFTIMGGHPDLFFKKSYEE